MPGLAWYCMIFHLKGATAGLSLDGSCPSGTSSSVMAFPFKSEDVALDVSIETLHQLSWHPRNPLVILGWSVVVSRKHP